MEKPKARRDRPIHVAHSVGVSHSAPSLGLGRTRDNGRHKPKKQQKVKVEKSVSRVLVSRRFPLIPLQNCLVTPELQWQIRG